VTSAAALEVEGLSKRYAGVAAMDGITFSVAPHSLHALVGENGAGKSTLVKCLAGAVRPDSGQMRLFGEPFAPRGPADAAAAGVGVVFQELSLVPDLTVAENIWFRREGRTILRTIRQGELERKTAALFERYGLQGIPVRARTRDLSVSQRQLVEIVKVISTQPRLFVLDEATSALSPREVHWTHARAAELAESGASVIYISHRLAEARALASQVTIFRSGRNVRTAALAEVSDDELIYQMLGRRVDRLYPAKPAAITGPPVLQVRNLELGSRLRGVTLDIRQGEILGVGGLQGQGQLQLFLSLFGVFQARGEIRVAGEPVRIRSPLDALRARIALALVPEDRQNEGLALPLSIRENIVLPSLSRLSRVGFITQRMERLAIRDVVARLRIAARDTEQPVQSLSGGNQQKVVIAKFLATSAQIFCLYDLTRGVDVGTKAEIFELMRSLADSGMSILFYSTELAELVNVADRVAVMSDGVVRGVLAGQDLTEAAILRLAMSQDGPPATAPPGPAAVSGEQGAVR
jgi:ribose transport system ATP-binding protein